MKAQAVRSLRAGGIGAEVSQVEIIDVGRIAIGAATLEGQKMGVLDIRNVVLDRGSRPRLAGLIGSELLSRYAVTIDYTRRTLTLRTPGYRPQGAKFSLPLGLAISPDGLSHPSIPAELDGIAGDFILDTGASGQVIVSEKFQETHQLFSGTGTILDFMSPGGIGGRAGMRMGLGKELHIGAFAFSPPIVAGIDRGNSTWRGSRVAHAAGLIGNGVLANFIVTLDLAAAHVYIEPVADRPHATTIFGTGMVLDKPDRDTFEVIDVLGGSAAERAGLHRGDRLVAVAGHPARELGIQRGSYLRAQEPRAALGPYRRPPQA